MSKKNKIRAVVFAAMIIVVLFFLNNGSALKNTIMLVGGWEEITNSNEKLDFTLLPFGKAVIVLSDPATTQMHKRMNVSWKYIWSDNKLLLTDGSGSVLYQYYIVNITIHTMQLTDENDKNSLSFNRVWKERSYSVG